MYSASASAALNSGLFARAITRSKPDGASSRAMSIALSGLSVSRIFDAIFPSSVGRFAAMVTRQDRSAQRTTSGAHGLAHEQALQRRNAVYRGNADIAGQTKQRVVVAEEPVQR